jgi:membrane protease YdiL (CAAX protease family)
VDEEGAPLSIAEERQLAQPTHCDYCAAALDPAFSFCRRCAKPYKPAYLVLPAVNSQPYEDDEVRIRKRAPQAVNLFFWFLSVIAVTGTFAIGVFGTDNMFHVQVFVQGALILVTIVFSVIHFPALAVQLKTPGIFTPVFLTGLAMLVGLLIVNFLYHFVLMDSLFDSLDLEEEAYAEIFPSFAGMLIFVCIIPGVMEEIAFRGLIQHWLHSAVSPRTAIIVASAMFSAAHFSVLSAPYLFAVGLVLGWLRWRTGSLYPSMIVHFLHNLAVILLLESL